MSAAASERRVAILGAGCAGLSLACELINRSPTVGIVLLDSRAEHARDRTWCGWTLPDAAYEECVSERWRRVRVRGGGLVAETSCARTPYRHIPADAYYERMLERIRASKRCELRLGVTVERVEPNGKSVVVGWAGGSEAFEHVFDGRPTPMQGRGGPASLIQHFLGHEVEADRDAFEPDIATLMDFDAPQDQGIHFFYVLPFSPRRALVEATFMMPRADGDFDYERRIADYLRERYGLSDWRIVRSERGRIPMSPAIPVGAPHPRHWRIGTGAGVVKPSTGYAFDAIHRDAARVAEAWLAGRPRPRIPRPRIANWLDRLMLSFLRRHPERAVTMFPAMFERCDPERLARFLSDRASIRDTLEIIAAVPRWPMIRHAVRSLGGRR